MLARGFRGFSLWSLDLLLWACSGSGQHVAEEAYLPNGCWGDTEGLESR